MPDLATARTIGTRAAHAPDAQKRRQVTLRKRASQRTAWETAYFERGGTKEQLVSAKAWFIEMIYPRLATVSPSALAAVLSATFSYGSKIRNSARNGAARKIGPHPSHYLALAELVHVEPPAEMRQLLDFSTISTGVVAEFEASMVSSPGRNAAAVLIFNEDEHAPEGRQVELRLLTETLQSF